MGIVLLVLGAMHFFNLYLFSRLRNRPRDVQVADLGSGSNLVTPRN